MIHQTKLIMGMPITLRINADEALDSLCETIFAHFMAIDERYSTYKPTSDISRLNDGALRYDQLDPEIQDVLERCDQTRAQTAGYFDIHHEGKLDPSGLVKGWAIQRAAELLHQAGQHDFYINAGGDVALSGKNEDGDAWRVGIRNPFNRREIVKVLSLSDCGVATSGAYVRGDHIYNPIDPESPPTTVASITVIGDTIYDADRFATAAFAMGESGIDFVANKPGLEGYMIDSTGIATFTNGFKRYVTV